MNRLDEILAFNQQFVDDKGYVPFETSKFPDKKLVIVSCMDTRLSDLLPRAMNINNGDAKWVKTAGGVVSEPFDSTMKSILVAIYELGAEEVLVIGHYGCGMSAINPEQTIQKIKDAGVSHDVIETLEHAGVDLNAWFQPIKSLPDSVSKSVNLIKNHPLMPQSVRVHGLMVDPQTGKLDIVVNDSPAR